MRLKSSKPFAIEGNGFGIQQAQGNTVKTLPSVQPVLSAEPTLERLFSSSLQIGTNLKLGAGTVNGSVS